ncbi:MAG: hypothetical protein U0Y68_11860 [Blastocatellia bacterium]
MKRISVSFVIYAVFILGVAWHLPAAAQTAPTVRTVSLVVNDLVYDPVTKKIYASVPSSAGARGNSITIIDPEKGTIEGSIFVGSEPNKIVVTDDGQYAYVGLDGAAAIRRFNIKTLTPEIQFQVGSDSFFGPIYVDDMAARPGCPEEIAVSMRYQGVSPRHAGVAMFVNGVRKKNTTATHTGSNVIEFGTSPNRLFGYNNETTDFGFRRMTINADGLTINDSAPNLVSGFGADIRAEGGWVYSNGGRVIDPLTSTLVGTYSGLQSGSLVLPDPTVGRTFFLQTSGSTLKLQAYNQETFIPLGSIDVLNSAPSSFRGLVRWGKDGIAFSATAGGNTQIYLVQSPFISAVNTKLNSVSAASFRGPKHGRESIASVFGTNLASTTATAANLPLPTDLGGTSVKVKDNSGTERLAPLFYVSPTQINYQIPVGTLPGDVTITVTNGSGSVSDSALVSQVAPGLFTANTNGQGVAAGYITRVKSDNSQTQEPIAQLDAVSNQFVPRPIDLGADNGTSTDRVFDAQWAPGCGIAARRRRRGACGL